MISARDSPRSRACASSPSPCSRSTAAACARCSPMRAPNRWCAPSRSSRAACRSSPSRSTSRPRPSALASRSSAWTTARVLRSAGPFRSPRCCSGGRFRASLRPGPRTRTTGARPGIRGSSANAYGPEGAPVIRVTLSRPSFPPIRTSNRRSFRMSSRPRTVVVLAAGAILGFCGALTSGGLADRPSEAAHSGHASRPVDGTALPWQEASLFAEVYERIKRDYVDDVDDHGLMEKALRGMVAALDPHSAYLDSEEFEEIRLSTMGSYPGVGIVDVGRAISHLKRDNLSGLKGLVLDLRNNPGGVLEAGVAVADDFLDSGVIVTADGRTAEARFRMDATPGDLIDGAPLVVLVNGGSASASEIVAGALKDHGRALLIGRRTYGKGSVQTVMPLNHGGAVKLTTSRYFTPSGTSIHGKGIIPDLVEEGPGIAPAELLTARGSPALADRDGDVRVALDALKTGHGFAQASTLPVAMRAFVP